MLAPNRKLRKSYAGTYRLASFLLKRYAYRAHMHDFPQTKALRKLLDTNGSYYVITIQWDSYYNISLGTSWLISPHTTYCTINLEVYGLSKQYFKTYVKRLSKSTESKVEEV